MTTEQLNQARAERWRQAGNPILTGEDAAAWLRETGICLFLPRSRQLATAAPSFVEATLGEADPTPARAAIEAANEILHRLLASGDAAALNLLGTAGLGALAEQPDFLATPETLPFIFALRGDKEWKRGPRGKSSPLTIEVWKLLSAEGPLTAIEVKDKLGRQLTEAAALRALVELWSHLRLEPVITAQQPARWQLLETRHQKQMQAGSTMSQAVALSGLVSLYLQSAVAASGDEVEIFLSPLASRSKIREVIKGLTATRQLSTLNLGPVELFHIEGALPEFGETDRVEGAMIAGVEALQASAEVSEEREDAIGEGRKRFVAKREAAQAPAQEKPERPARPAAKRAPGGGAKPEGDRRPFAPRPNSGGAVRKPYGTRSASGAPSFNPREPWKEDRKPASARDAHDEGGAGERRPFARGDKDGGGERKPFVPRSGETGRERRTFAPRGGDRPFKPGPAAKPFGERKPFAARPGAGDGERRPFTPRTGADGERKPYSPRAGGSGGERKPFAPRGGDRPYKPRPDAKPFSDRKPYTPREGGPGQGGGRPFKPRSDAKPFGERKSFGDRKPFGAGKPFAPREGSGAGRKTFGAPAGDRPFKPRAGTRSFAPREGGAGSDRKPYSPRGGAGGGERKSLEPQAGDRPFKPRSDRSNRPDAKPFRDGKEFKERKPFGAREGRGGKPAPPRSTGSAGFPGSSGSRDRAFEPREGEKLGEGRAASRGAKPAGSFKAGGFKAAAKRSPGMRKTLGAARPRTAATTSSGKPRAGVKAPSGRPGPRASRGPGSSFKRPGRPGAKGGKGRSK